MQQPYDPNATTASAPMPVLYGSAYAPDAKEPSVVRGAWILCLLPLLPLGIFILITASSLNDKRATGPFIAYCGAAAFFLLLFIGLKRRWQPAWYVQIVVSVFGLLSIPVGTVIHGMILRRWFKPEVKNWFGI